MKEEKDIFNFIEKRKADLPDAAYFDNLTRSVIESQRTKGMPLYKRPVFWISAAAAVVLTLIVVRFDSQEVPQTNALAELEHISNNDVLAYVEENIEDFDIDLIAEFIPDATIDKEIAEIESELIPEQIEDLVVDMEISFDGITRDDILDYLEEEELDINDLEENSFI